MNDKNLKVEKINVTLLHSGLAFQRKVTDMNRVKSIASNWDWKLFECPCVSFRDGIYNVIDGQHTIAAYKMKNGVNSELSCKVAYGLTIEEESKWFYDETQKSKLQSLNAVYNARLCSKDKKLLALIDDLNQCGLILGINVNRGRNVINAIKTIENIYQNMNSVDFIACYKLLKDTWGGDSETLKETFLRGMKKFYDTYKGSFDSVRFLKSLSRINPKDIKLQADSDIYMKDNSIRYARVFVEHYNKKLRTLPLLKISSLED